MKKLILSFVAIATISLSSFGQAPEGFKYQAVVRDAGNTILNNQAVGMRMTIQQGSIGGTTVYQETFAPTTNGYGLVNLEIGSGTVVSGDFTTIDWANGPYFIETAVDITGGTSYAVMGTSQLMSVPYALYAKTSGNGAGPVGPQGPAGNDGATGPQGPAGNDGATGPQGPAGNDGATGPQGPAGNDGATGPQGPAGNDGATGPQGPAGNDGATGPQGPAGNDGATGLQGPAGNDGATGPQGPAGNDGATGPQGPAGNDGATGPQGPAGNDGATGPQGPAGNDGATGPQGPAGNDGATGPQGPAGNDGATGPQGPAGNDGATGPAGTYTAGTGIDITAGVISATSSTAPEYLMVSPDAISAGYVSFGSASAVNGIAYNSATNEFTLKAGKTYMLDGAVYMHTTTSSNTYSYVFYDKTNNASIGTEAYQRTADYSGTIINQPSMAAIVTPVTDIQVGIKDIYGSTGGFISSRGFFRVIEIK